MREHALSFAKRFGSAADFTISLLLIMVLAVISSGCVSNVKNLAPETKYLDEEAVAKQVAVEDRLEGHKLVVSIQAMGDRPYEVNKTTQTKYACGNTRNALKGLSDSPGNVFWAPVVLPMGLVADTVSLCQKDSYSRTTIVEKGLVKDSSLPPELIGEVSGYLNIAELSSGQVFADRSALYPTTSGTFEIELPQLNNGGTLRVQFDGNVTVGSQQLPLHIDRQITL
jgi:uncharacterized protein YceK